MHGIAWSVPSRKQLFAIVCISMIFLSGCLGTSDKNQEQDSQNGEITLSFGTLLPLKVRKNKCS